MTMPQLQSDPFEALGDPTRRRIIELLAAEPQSVQQLADQLPVSRPAVSRHLRLLKRAGLVSMETTGTRNIYRLDDLGAAEVRDYLERVWGAMASRFALYAANSDHSAENKDGE